MKVDCCVCTNKSDDQWEEIKLFIRTKCEGLLLCGWGNPELAIFAKVGRADGFDARQAILMAYPSLCFAKSQGINNVVMKHISMSMDCLTPIFGMSNEASHTAMADCDCEAVVISAFIRYLVRKELALKICRD